MKAVVLTGHGGLEKLEYRHDVPVPRPAPGEVLIEVTACGMNNTDVWVRQGAYGTEQDPQEISTWRRGRSTLKFPRIQGTDIVGRIAAVGEGVPETRVDSRVMVDFSIYNRTDDSLADIDYIGHGRDGGYAEYTTVPSDHAHQVKTDLPDAELATFSCAYLTGEHMLDRARVTAGENVLITGAGGGVGSGLIQLCRARGAVPFAVTSQGKGERLREIGAEDLIFRDNARSFFESVREVMGERPVDVVADLVAGPLFNDLLRLLRPEGRYTTAGAIAGPVVQLDLRTVYLKHLELHGSSQGTRRAFAHLMEYIEQGKISAVLDRAFPLSKFHQAQQAFMNKDYIGKLVVVPDRHWEKIGAPYAA